jgi:parvulin-like peptidyl-prolyl isomerase
VDGLVVRALKLQAAQQDTLAAVPPERVDQTFEQVWADEVARFGGEAALQQALATAGRTLPQHRERLRQQLEEELLLQRWEQFRRQEIRVPPVEEAEIRNFLANQQGNLPPRPATIDLRQVVLIPEPADSAREAAREEAERILQLLRDGEEFEELARRFSDDQGTAQRGGEIGWVRQGERIPEIEEAIFGLSRGGVSGVVETIYGAHILRVDRVRGPERLVYHILVSATLTDEDVNRTRVRAGEIRDSVAAGAELGEFEGTGEGLGIPEFLDDLRLDQLGSLPAPYAVPLQNAAQGDVVGPLEFTYQGQQVVVVAEVTEVREAGEFTFEELSLQVRQVLAEEKFQERLVERLRSEMHVETRW